MKLIATIVATIVLLFGGVALAPASVADDSQNPGCSDTDPQLPPCAPDPTCSDTDSQMPPCTTPPCVEDSQTSCDSQAAPKSTRDELLVVQLYSAEQTVREYRVLVASLQTRIDSLTADLARIEQVADRRAVTIKRLRAKLEAARQ